ncbi:MAG: sigma-54 dependent transcriptional regulator, partial [Desulfobacterales bacterium]
ATETIIGQSRAIQKVFRLIDKIAPSDSTVLITGETGTGKGLVAHAIHSKSRRKNESMISINCGAIPESLLESELFGHVKGAFTGAMVTKTGKFELANGGTIFLDEIGDMSPDLQVKILRVLEEGEFEAVGGNRTHRVDVRFIAATHRDLEKRVESGRFREDLFYRLYVIPLKLPPLRERIEDIPLLVNHFLDLFNDITGSGVEGVSADALDCLTAHSWPGNVRELKNMMERLVVLKDGGTISLEDLPPKLRGRQEISFQHPSISVTDDGISLNTAVTEFEKALILQSLEKTNWVKNKAAKLLKLNRTTLVEKIKRYRLDGESNSMNAH